MVNSVDIQFLENIVASNKLSERELILLFSWWICNTNGVNRFITTDINDVFDRLSIKKPANTSLMLSRLAGLATPLLLKKGNSYSLENTTLRNLNTKYGDRPNKIVVEKLLKDLPQKIANTAESDYLKEALLCFQNQAFRASIVMTWNLVYSHVCDHVFHTSLAVFNAQLIKTLPKTGAHPLSKREDFEQLKESEILQVAKSANIITGNMHKILKEKLDRRNIAAHPSGVAFTQYQAEDYISDLITNILLKVK